ncbi:MAG: hypothetical protein HKO66_09335 [Saprospiraceae bacterium]|nr:glucosaminidase domain-containing protein [Bacteroidia bacterium]NNE15465.1 hypothetical protein [Saprospiraceae bacterium]NNL92420.1 hypothetical protein [Saprospiraceae bacterium]
MYILNKLLFIVFLGSFSNGDLDIAAYNYIDNYKELAIIEMHRTGVPASIKLAQALHESHFGKSDLAKQAKNHFGIKCKSYWKGYTYYHKDDDLDPQGNLINSCFRSYESVFDSYIDHSNFLSQTAHYLHLFNISKTDYKAWAHGLQNAGYATDPNYAKKLIKFIEKYNLSKLDNAADPFKSLSNRINNQK